MGGETCAENASNSVHLTLPCSHRLWSCFHNGKKTRTHELYIFVCTVLSQTLSFSCLHSMSFHVFPPEQLGTKGGYQKISRSQLSLVQSADYMFEDITKRHREQIMLFTCSRCLHYCGKNRRGNAEADHLAAAEYCTRLFRIARVTSTKPRARQLSERERARN